MHVNNEPETVARVRASAIFPLLVVATAAYFSALMYLPVLYSHALRIVRLVPLQLFAFIVAVAICGAIQHSVSRSIGATALRLWAAVAVSAVCAPLMGALSVLCVFLLLAESRP